jgi:hypothetical protein
LYLWNPDYSQWEQFAVLARYFRLFLAVFASCRSLLLRGCRRGKSEDFRGELCFPGCFSAAFNSDNSHRREARIKR